MKFTEQFIKDLYLIEPEKKEDERGFFARIFCQNDFTSRGLESNFIQSSIAYNLKKGTLRGMHFQNAPFQETKLVRCTKGAIFDVVIDLRSDSPTYRKWFGVELSSENRFILYVPIGFAHGYQTLCDETEVSYQMSAPHHPESAKALRWNDPAFAIQWPLPVTMISKRDETLADFV